MALSAGTRLGPYEILEPLGAGGMGEVYRSRDTRLDRTVAIKVLPAHLSTSPELRHRLEREARAVSQLNHPHICTLHDVGRESEVDFLVMEYLEGETLAHRLRKGPLPLDQALRYATEISDALDKAHRQGVIHRDLKPGNIMLTKSGAKLLDFGLAKLRRPESADNLSRASALATEDRPQTEEGTILGTYPYMSPEQLESQEADPRTDLFAFGAVLYEMATGQRAFQGKSRASLIAAIMSSEPRPIGELQPMMPPLLDRVVKRCLAKDPEERWQSAGDLATELRWIAEGITEAGEHPLSEARRRMRPGLAWAAGGALLGALLTGLGVWAAMRPAPHVPKRFNVDVRPVSLAVGPWMDPGPNPAVLSPDGTRLVYRASGQLYLRRLDRFEATAIPGTEVSDLSSFFFSPDGEWLGFFSGGQLKKARIEGGEPLVLCAAPGVFSGASWGPDDTIIFTRDFWTGGGLSRVSAAGGTPEVLTTPDETAGETSHVASQVLPGGKAALFTVMGRVGAWEEMRVAVLSAETGLWRTLVEGGMDPRYVPSGHLLYAREGSILAAPFDLQELKLAGPSVPVLDDVRMNRWVGTAQFDVSESGSAVYVSGYPRPPNRTLVWVDRHGNLEPVTQALRPFRDPVLSPDGRRLAATILGPPAEGVWVYDLARDTWTRLTFEGDAGEPVWSPDGKRVAFSSNASGRFSLFWTAADGSGAAEQLTHTNHSMRLPSSFSPDGKMLVSYEQNLVTGWDISILQLDSDRASSPLLATSRDETNGKLSPDGRWLAYVSYESGQAEVFVRPYPGPGKKWVISTDGGDYPVWARNGRELFYRSGDKLMAVPVRLESDFVAGTPQRLFDAPWLAAGVWTGNYDISPDGQRFVMVKRSEQGPPPQKLVIIPDWLEELKRRVPTD